MTTNKPQVTFSEQQIATLKEAVDFVLVNGRAMCLDDDDERECIAAAILQRITMPETLVYRGSGFDV